MNKVSRNWFMLSCLILAALVVTSCASRKAAWDAAPETVLGAKVDQQEFDKKMAAADSFWQKRDDEKAARQAIAIYKEALKMAPENTNLLEKLAVSHWFVAYYHLAFQEGSKNKYLKILDQGVTFAERGIMTLSKEFKERLQKGEKIEKIIHLIGKEGVPMMYWYSTNLSLWAKKDGFTTLLAHKDRVKQIMTHILKLDENFNYAAPHRYFGAFYAVAPSFAGGDNKKSREHFDIAIKNFPQNPAAKRLMCQYLIIKNEEGANEFKTLLNDVLNSDPEKIPELAPEIRGEKKWAKKLLDDIEEYFDIDEDEDEDEE